MMALEAAPAGAEHVDAEMQWAATEMAQAHFRAMQESGKTVTVASFARAYCPTVANLVAERLGAESEGARLSAAEATRAGLDELVKVDPAQKLDYLARIGLSSRAVAAAACERARNPKVQVPAFVEYWPFGQEGGFCNPYKLDAAED